MSKIKKWAMSLAAMLVVVGVGVFAIQSPAAASPSCIYNYVCLYQDAGGAGSSIYWADSPGSCLYVGGSFNDQATAIRNDTAHRVTFYDNSNCTGASVGLGAGAAGGCGGCLQSYINDLGGFPYFFNDRISAVYFG